MRHISRVFFSIATVTLTAAHASAQQIPWNDRVFANISVGVTGGSDDLTRTRTFELYDETATITARRDIKGGAFFDLVVGRQIRGVWGGALGYSRRQKDGSGSVEGQIPDPIEFDRFRTVTEPLSGLKHSENWLMPMAVWFHPLAEKIDLMAMAGPAFVWVSNAQGDAPTVRETPSGAALDVTTAVTKKTGAGIALVGDVRYLLRPNIGVGAYLRFVRAGVTLPEGQDVGVGGVQFGVGARIRY